MRRRDSISVNTYLQHLILYTTFPQSCQQLFHSILVLDNIAPLTEIALYQNIHIILGNED